MSEAVEHLYSPKGKFKDISGKKFNHLTAKRIVRKGIYGGVPSIFWEFQCECGNVVEKPVSYLNNAAYHSCGCIEGALISKAKIRHGCSRRSGCSLEWKSWTNMKYRCCNPKHDQYNDYGGRGITVCERWMHSFENFLADMGSRPSRRHSIERIDGSKGYEPGNCIWATREQQARNTRRNVNVEIDGEVLCVAEWARRWNKSDKQIYWRISRGWNPVDAILK